MTKQKWAAVRPMTELRPHLTPALDGSQGVNRADHAQLQIVAVNDIEAMTAFLSEYDQSPGTHRIYSRECERLMLWAYHECHKPISSLTRQDFEGYINFLMDPQPAAQWCGIKARKEKPEWRPFVGPLEESAVFTAIAALNSLMSYLVDAGYLSGNPLGLIRQRRRKMNAIGNVDGKAKPGKAPLHGTVVDEEAKVERFFDDVMWKAINAAVEAMQSTDEEKNADYERARFVCAFLYLLAPRVHEMETHTMNCFREVRGLWWWNVVGKGAKSARVPVTDDMLKALARDRISLGLPSLPDRSDTSPLLRSTRFPGKGITARWLNMLLKDIFSRACAYLPESMAWKAEKLRAASAHWGRHTSITAKVDAGMGLHFVQKDARHDSPRTTGHYTHDDELVWHAEAQKLRLNWSESVRSAETALKKAV